MPRKARTEVSITRVNSGESHDSGDFLATEEPLEIRIIYGAASGRSMKNISVTMRTPGEDFDLALGFLYTEGIITGADQVEEIFNNPEDCDNRQDNIVIVSLKPEVTLDLQSLERHFYTTSSCGVCGKASINAIRTVCPAPGHQADVRISALDLHRLPALLNQNQDIFGSTGGLHASALFNRDLELLLVKEDVGRHNALDKLIGSALQKDMLPLSGHTLLLSGRASFELIQKAAMAGIKIVAAIGAPSSLAVDLAREFEMTLVGFLRNERFNIYCGAERISLNALT
jgi:FdhD protein